MKSNTAVAENPQGNFRACPPPCANGSAVADIHQSMTMGLAHYHPMNAHFAFYATGYAWRSVVTTGLVLAWDVRNDTAAERRTLALAVAETQRLRRYTVAGDVWWLTPQTPIPEPGRLLVGKVRRCQRQYPAHQTVQSLPKMV